MGEKGEADSTFFRIMAAKNSKTIREMRINEETILKTPEEIHWGVVEYFQKFLASNHQPLLPDLAPWVEQVVCNEDNVAILELPSI